MASTPSKCGIVGQTICVVTGALAIAGVAALVWVAFSRRGARTFDPLLEADKRINELENSLQRLQDNFGHAIVG